MTPRGCESAGGSAAARVSTTILLPRPGSARLLLRRRVDMPAGASDCEAVIQTAEGWLGLGPFAEEDAIASWRGLAAATGAVPVIESAAGDVYPLEAQLGRLQLRGLHRRRRMPASGRKRPRFLARRKAARLPPRPVVYRESEIAAGASA